MEDIELEEIKLSLQLEIKRILYYNLLKLFKEYQLFIISNTEIDDEEKIKKWKSILVPFNKDKYFDSLNIPNLKLIENIKNTQKYSDINGDIIKSIHTYNKKEINKLKLELQKLINLVTKTSKTSKVLVGGNTEVVSAITDLQKKDFEIKVKKIEQSMEIHKKYIKDLSGTVADITNKIPENELQLKELQLEAIKLYIQRVDLDINNLVTVFSSLSVSFQEIEKNKIEFTKSTKKYFKCTDILKNKGYTIDGINIYPPKQNKSKIIFSEGGTTKKSDSENESDIINSTITAQIASEPNDTSLDTDYRTMFKINKLLKKMDGGYTEMNVKSETSERSDRSTMNKLKKLGNKLRLIAGSKNINNLSNDEKSIVEEIKSLMGKINGGKRSKKKMTPEEKKAKDEQNKKEGLERQKELKGTPKLSEERKNRKAAKKARKEAKKASKNAQTTSSNKSSKKSSKKSKRSRRSRKSSKRSSTPKSKSFFKRLSKKISKKYKKLKKAFKRNFSNQQTTESENNNNQQTTEPETVRETVPTNVPKNVPETETESETVSENIPEKKIIDNNSSNISKQQRSEKRKELAARLAAVRRAEAASKEDIQLLKEEEAIKRREDNLKAKSLNENEVEPIDKPNSSIVGGYKINSLLKIDQELERIRLSKSKINNLLNNKKNSKIGGNAIISDNSNFIPHNNKNTVSIDQIVDSPTSIDKNVEKSEYRQHLNETLYKLKNQVPLNENLNNLISKFV
jgi:hypothetical protein